MAKKIIYTALLFIVTFSYVIQAADNSPKDSTENTTATASDVPKEQPDFSNSNKVKNQQKELPLAKTPSGWTNSLKKAVTEARNSNKYILAFFTGSDWCQYCGTIEKEIFNTPEFKKWSNKNVIKLFLDFPKYHQLPQNISAQNTALFRRLGLQGFPTIVFFTPQGQPITTIGYLPGGGANWIKHVEMLLPKKSQIETSLKASLQTSTQNNALLLLGIYNSSQDNATEEKNSIQKLFSTPSLLLPSGKEIILAQLDYAKLSAKEKAVISKISKDNSFPKFILLNSKHEAILTVDRDIKDLEKFADRITGFINKPEYNGEWISDYSKALQLARLYNKPLLLFFTGSDWCVYCKEMKEKIFETEAFTQKAKDYILVELDFPRGFALPEEIYMQNAVISDAYKIEGFPTIVVEKSNGMPVGAIGYSNQNVSDFLKSIDKALGI